MTPRRGGCEDGLCTCWGVQEAQDGQKTDVERLGNELASEREKSAKVPTLETTILRQKLAGEQQLPVRFWSSLTGRPTTRSRSRSRA